MALGTEREQNDALFERQVDKALELSNSVLDYTRILESMNNLPVQVSENFELDREVVGDVLLKMNDLIGSVYLNALKTAYPNASKEELNRFNLIIETSIAEVSPKSFAFVPGTQFDILQHLANNKSSKKYSDRIDQYAISGAVIGILQIIDHMMDRNIYGEMPEAIAMYLDDVGYPMDEYQDFDDSENLKFCYSLVEGMMKLVKTISGDWSEVREIESSILDALYGELRTHKLSNKYYREKNLENNEIQEFIRRSVENVALNPAAKMIYATRKQFSKNYINLPTLLSGDTKDLELFELLSTIAIRVLDDAGDLENDIANKNLNFLNQEAEIWKAINIAVTDKQLLESLRKGKEEATLALILIHIRKLTDSKNVDEAKAFGIELTNKATANLNHLTGTLQQQFARDLWGILVAGIVNSDGDEQIAT